ncbi:MAG: hypothetical protein JXB04_09220 [Kiritimatiellae bacterium]|nr:hypothetical protein [Kiritimatiellia bacterium]
MLLPAPLTIKAAAEAGSGWSGVGYAILAMLVHGLLAGVAMLVSVISGLRAVRWRPVVLWWVIPGLLYLLLFGYALIELLGGP